MSFDSVVQVTEAQLEDAAVIAGIHRVGLRLAYGDRIPQAIFDPLTPEDRTRSWEHRLQATGSTWVARSADELVGFCTLHPIQGGEQEHRTGEIPSFFVHSDHRRKGIGRLLAEHVRTKAHEEGCTELSLWVFECNQGARAFYTALGFVASGDTRVFWQRAQKTWCELRYVCAI